MSESDFLKDIFRNSRMEAVCKCAAILIAEEHRDLARDVLKAMKIDQAQLTGLKKMFTGGA
jgi:class 3 adenylate cyclase